MSKYDEFSRAKYCAFLYLNRKMYTRYEMLQKLLKKEYTPEICEKTVDFLVEAGYIDDADYALRYTKDAVNFKKHGTMRIRHDLRQKGISFEIIDKTIDELEIDYSENLSLLVSQKAERLDLSDRKQRDRLIGFLVRRGYKLDDIFAAIREYGENKEIFN